MERVVKEQEQKLTFRKIGGGSMRLRKRIIKPDQVFQAFLSEIPEAFRGFVIPVGEESLNAVKASEQQDKPKNIPGNKAQYVIEEKSKGWFNVVDKQGKAINERALRKETADELLKALNS